MTHVTQTRGGVGLYDGLMIFLLSLCWCEMKSSLWGIYINFIRPVSVLHSACLITCSILQLLNQLQEMENEDNSEFTPPRALREK